MPKFPSVAELKSMSVARLQTIDIATPEQEQLIQSIIDDRVEEGSGSGNIYRLDIPDIKTPEEEAHYQKIIDDRVRKSKPTRVVPRSNKPKVLENEQASQPTAPTGAGDNTPKLVDYTITEDDLKRQPQLVTKGAQAGDVIQVPETVLAPATTNNVPRVTKSAPWCDSCESKGGFHRKNCIKRTA